jgi:diguanylate cyclase (GGDEF)-like protein/PAS domain S-box-containing protein
LQKQKSLSNQFIIYFAIAFVVTCGFALVVLFINISNTYSSNFEQSKLQKLEQKKELISTQVKQIISLIRTQEKFALINQKESLIFKLNGLKTNIQKELSATNLSDEYEHKNKVKSIVAQFIQTHKNIYAFAVDRQQDVIFPMSNHSTLNTQKLGHHVTKSLRELVNQQLMIIRVGEFVESSFRADPLSNSYQLFFVQIPNTEIVVGIGIDKSAVINASKEQIKQQFNEFSFAQGGYFWVVENGRVVVHQDKHIIGLSLDEIDNLIKSDVFSVAAKQLATQGDVIFEYPWVKQGANQVSHKISYASTIQEYNWIVGTGFHLEDYYNEIKVKQKAFEQSKKSLGATLIIIFLAILVLFFILLKKIARKFSIEFELFGEFLYGLKSPDFQIDLSQLRYREFRSVIGTINEIVLNRVKTANQQRVTKKAIALQASVFEATNEGIIITDPTGRIESVNPAFERITGYKKEEVIGKPSDMLSYEKTNKYFVHRLSSELRNKGYWQGEFTNMRKNGDAYVQWTTINELRSELGIVEHYVAVFSDVSERKALEELARQQAILDPLTGIDNLESANNFLAKEWAVAVRNSQPISMILLGIDEFDQYNEHYGKIVGDECITLITNSLVKIIQRPRDLLARMDESCFSFILPNTDVDGCKKLAEQAQKQIARLKLRHPSSKYDGLVTVSIGVATMYPDKTVSSQLLTQNVTIAMQAATKQGGNKIEAYS